MALSHLNTMRAVTKRLRQDGNISKINGSDLNTTQCCSAMALNDSSTHYLDCASVEKHWCKKIACLTPVFQESQTCPNQFQYQYIYSELHYVLEFLIPHLKTGQHSTITQTLRI